MIRYTNIFDLIFKILLFVGSLVLAGSFEPIAYMFDLKITQLSNFVGAPSWAPTVIDWIAAIVLWVFCIVVLSDTILRPTLAEKLYVFAITRIWLTDHEAFRVGFLFDGSLEGRWYPLRSFRASFPVLERRAALYDITNDIAQRHGLSVVFPQGYTPDDRFETKSYLRIPHGRIISWSFLALGLILGISSALGK